MKKKPFLSEDTFVSDPDDDLIITKSARIYCGGAPRLEAHGKSKELGRKAIGIGRDKHNGVIIADPQVSKFHAIMTFRGGRAFIKDTGSTNGTMVNNSRIPADKEVELDSGDVLVLGTTKIGIRYR